MLLAHITATYMKSEYVLKISCSDAVTPQERVTTNGFQPTEGSNQAVRASRPGSANPRLDPIMSDRLILLMTLQRK